MSGYPKSFWFGTAVGGAVMVYGLVGLLGAASSTHPVELAIFLIGAAIAHDLVVAPIVLLLATAICRFVPVRSRPPTMVVLVIGAVTSLFAYPFVRGFGRISTNPSILPKNYGFGLALILCGVLVAGIVWAVARLRSH